MSAIHLRPVIEQDLPALFEHQREPEANAMAAFAGRERDAFMTHWRKILGDDSAVAMAILVDGRVAGHIGCWSQHGQRLLGYWIAQAHWGKGVATRALSLLLGQVAERPLYAHVAGHNAASIRVLEKSGFVYDAEATCEVAEPADGIEERVYVLAMDFRGRSA